MHRVTATSLASHTHFQCDLYLHQAYHGVSSSVTSNTGGSASHARYPEAPAIQLAALISGDTWESALFNHLDQHDLLLTVKGPPLTGTDIVSVIELDERSHFFVTGIAFWPPRKRYVQEYEKRGIPVENVPNWALAKPDLIEIWCEDNGSYVWRIIDAKASKDVKASHLVQTYFYYLCLTYMLPSSFVSAPTVAIWLPPGPHSGSDLGVPSPSLKTLYSIPIAPLVAPLTELLFERLPSILSSARQDVSWHFNPVCKSCPFSSTCRARVEIEGGLGKAGELSLREAGDVRGFMRQSKTIQETVPTVRAHGSDIEDMAPTFASDKPDNTSELAQLAGLLEDDWLLETVERRWPATVKRVQKILCLQPRNTVFSRNRRGQDGSYARSPVVNAALTNNPEFTNRRIYTLPAYEDIEILISLIIDPSRSASASAISEFCISTRVASAFQITARSHGFTPQHHVHGSVGSLIPELSRCVRGVLALHQHMLSEHSPGTPRSNRVDTGRKSTNLPRTQFYVWSVPERDAIQKHLVAVALGSSNSTGVDLDDIRLCIGALCEGASLLATVFQPHVLEGALLGFLGKKGKSTGELAAVMHRFGLAPDGEQTAEMMRQRLLEEIKRLGSGRTAPQDGGQRSVGLLPRVVVLKKELRRLVALPVPGWWDVKEAASVFCVAGTGQCPDESELFRRYWHDEDIALRKGMEERNDACGALVSELRRRLKHLPGGRESLINPARVLSAEWVDVCKIDALRKLFYMQQFEVLLKLQDLWDSRIEACPEAPLLMFREKSAGESAEPRAGKSDDNKPTYYTYTFDLIAGNLEVSPERDRDRSFFDYLLVEEHDNADFLAGGRSSKSHIDSDISQLPLEAWFDDLCVSGVVFPLNRYTRSKWEEGQPREVKDGRLWVADIRDVRLTGRTTEVVLRIWSSQGYKKTLSPGKKYRLSPRLVDFNTTKVLSTLVELDLWVDSTTQGSLPPFAQLIMSPKSFGSQCHYASLGSEDNHSKKVVIDKEASLHRLYAELRDLGNKDAEALVLKASQRKAAQRIIRERLTVIWGPPGSGKSYTIALSLLRMLEVQAGTRTLAATKRQIIFLTAMTHAAIQACLSKLHRLMEHYRAIPDLSLGWLDGLTVEYVLFGATHPKPGSVARRGSRAGSSAGVTTWIYAGTVYQLYTFGKRLDQGVDCVIIDEAGQLGLGAASLVLRALSWNASMWSGKVVVAGDREQLAPIFAGKYPDMADGQRLLFGSVLDCLMDGDEWGGSDSLSTGATTPRDMSVGMVVQLLENFRLNPDLGDFVQTIYRRAFKPQKAQEKQVATQLRQLEKEFPQDEVLKISKELLLALSFAMLGKNQTLFRPPRKQDMSRRAAVEPVREDYRVYSDITPTPQPISLALVHLRVRGDPYGEVAYESHVRTEAKVAAALVRLLRKVYDGKAEEREGDTFVACPHRVQRAAVKAALNRWEGDIETEGVLDEDEDEQLERLIREMKIVSDEESNEPQPGPHKLSNANRSNQGVVIDTIERLQGSEAPFVICLFSHTHRGSISTALPFLLARRRLNVAISRAKTLCIVIASEEVLQPDVSVFVDKESASGYAFLRSFQERAWNAEIEVDLED